MLSVFYFAFLCSFLLIALVLSPALAVWPQLALKPRQANCVPIISLLGMAIIARCLIAFGWYIQTLFLPISAVLIPIAIWRTVQTFKRHQHQWHAWQGWLLLINVSLVLPILVSLTLSAFYKEDGLSSWNYWGLFYYFQNTDAQTASSQLYPQLYPLILSMVYKLLGQIDVQGPVRFIISFFPLLTLNAIAFTLPEKIISKKAVGLYCLIAIITVLPQIDLISAFKFYSWGYADPVMTAVYVCALSALIHYVKHERGVDLILFVASGIMASLTKQPGLWLACVAGPVMLFANAYWRQCLYRSELIAILLLALPGMIWLIGSHTAFYHNAAVIHRSLNGHEPGITPVMMTFSKSCYTYFFKQPQLLVLVIAGVLSARRNKHLTLILLISAIPTWLLWFTFGAYHFRLGLHVIAQFALIITASGVVTVSQSKLKHQHLNPLKTTALWFFSVFFVLSTILAIILYKEPQAIHPNWSIKKNRLFDSYHLVLHRHLGQGAHYVRQHIFNDPAIKLWAGNKLMASLFYGHNPVVRGGDSPSTILAIIKHNSVDYLVGAGTTGGHTTEALNHLVKQCPESFQSIPLPGALHGYTLYRYKGKQQPCQLEQSEQSL